MPQENWYFILLTVYILLTNTFPPVVEWPLFWSKNGEYKSAKECQDKGSSIIVLLKMNEKRLGRLLIEIVL